MSIKFNEPENKIIGRIIKLIETSYEIICDTERKPPNKAYLELLDQPAKSIPYTPNAEITKINKRLKEKSNK